MDVVVAVGTSAASVVPWSPSRARPPPRKAPRRPPRQAPVRPPRGPGCQPISRGASRTTPGFPRSRPTPRPAGASASHCNVCSSTGSRRSPPAPPVFTNGGSSDAYLPSSQLAKAFAPIRHVAYNHGPLATEATCEKGELTFGGVDIICPHHENRDRPGLAQLILHA
jgi:hypothetical protein